MAVEESVLRNLQPVHKSVELGRNWQPVASALGFRARQAMWGLLAAGVMGGGLLGSGVILSRASFLPFDGWFAIRMMAFTLLTAITIRHQMNVISYAIRRPSLTVLAPAMLTASINLLLALTYWKAFPVYGLIWAMPSEFSTALLWSSPALVVLLTVITADLMNNAVAYWAGEDELAGVMASRSRQEQQPAHIDPERLGTCIMRAVNHRWHVNQHTQEATRLKISLEHAVRLGLRYQVIHYGHQLVSLHEQDKVTSITHSVSQQFSLATVRDIDSLNWRLESLDVYPIPLGAKVSDVCSHLRNAGVDELWLGRSHPRQESWLIAQVGSRFIQIMRLRERHG